MDATVGGIAVQAGSIWRAMFGNVPRLLVVIATHYEYATILVLHEEAKTSRIVGFTTLSGEEYYGFPDMVSYKFYADFDTLEGQLTPDAFDLLLNKTAESLGLRQTASVIADQVAECWDKMDRLRAQNEGLQERNKELEAELVKLKTECTPADDAQQEIARLTAQRDLYKEEYKELLASLIGK
jgi:cell division protein FtsB